MRDSTKRIGDKVQQPRVARFKVAALGLCGLCAALALAACQPKDAANTAPAGQPAAPEVGVALLSTQSQQLQAQLPGRTRAYQMAEVRPQVGGIVQKQLFEEGAQVKAGQALYQLDTQMLQAQLASAEAALAKAEASAQRQALLAKRNAELVKITAISQQQHEESQAAAAVAKAEVAAARAQVQTARINLRYARIEAPISGRISLSSVTPGALVTANQTTALTEIVQTNPMYVDFTQSTTELLQLQNDWQAGRYQQVDADTMQIGIQLEDGSPYPHSGKLRFSGLIANPSMGTVTLRAVVPNPEGKLLPGMFVQAKLPTGVADDALLLPQQAVSRDLTGRATVLVVQEQDGTPTVQKRAVELSHAVGAFWLVDSGLQAGERVVVQGFQRVKPGDKVRPVEVDMQQPSRAEQIDPQAAAAALRASLSAAGNPSAAPSAATPSSK